MSYFLIFFTKAIENTLSTLRIIVIAYGRKQIGALLQFIIAITWILCTGTLIKDIDNPIKIICFASGCYIGSLLGSILEEKFYKK
jgi:uncharacterized protein YebE (UPF0316 family)